MSQGKDHSGSMKKKRGRFHNKNSVNLGDIGKEVLEKLDENSRVVKQFQDYATELDDIHDRFERIVKLSRDITIESKRIIFFLHTLDKKEKQETILNEAEKRLENVAKTSFKNIAKEIEGHDVYQYIRAYKPGLQEFVEAATFYHYLQNKSLQDWNQIEKSFIYTIEDKSKNVSDQQVSLNEQKIKTVRTPLIPHDYILGIADLTGELMRKCINNLSSGNITGCFETCVFVRSIYQGFLGCLGISGKEINRKLYTLKQSLNKIESVCYAIKIRGSEIPKHMLATVAIANMEKNDEEDEGYNVY